MARRDCATCGGRCTHWRVSGRWYLVVLALPVLLSLAAVGLGLLSTAGRIQYDLRLPLAHFLPFVLYMIVFTGVAEEPGWRGFALPWLQRTHSASRASWILGVIWGLWHLPFTVYYSWGPNLPVVLVSLVISLLGLTLGIVGWTMVNTWVYNSTRSVWLVILLHGWGNAVQSYLVLSSDNMLAQTLYGILPWALAILLLRRYGEENLATVPRHRLPDPSPAGAPAPAEAFVA